MAARKKTTLVAREAFTAEVDGEPVMVHAGETVDSTHPLVRGREGLFDQADRSDHEAPQSRR